MRLFVSRPGLSLFPDIRIVLVETTHPGNIGAAARAMKNMGLASLYLVSPKAFPHQKAVWRSASAEDLLAKACVCQSVEEAVAGCRLIIGTSARERRIPWPMLSPRECGRKVVSEMGPDHRVAILFGREASGLKNRELQKCHFHVNIPTSQAYSSLNLAMAVQVICYEILSARQEDCVEAQNAPQKWDMELATEEEVEYFFDHLESTLVELAFHDPENPRQLMVRLRRMFSRIRPDQMEISVLRGILTAVNQLCQRSGQAEKSD